MNNKPTKNQKIFTNEEIKNFSGFYDSLLQIHNRLINSGHIIQDNHILHTNNANNLKKK